jgi:hypothetical protein
MSIELTTRIIQFILAPVVMISTCAILTGGMLSHYGAISARLRALARERLELLRQPDGSLGFAGQPADEYTRERLHEIDTQTPQLLRRHEFVQRGILATYLAILCFIASMFVIALSALTNSPFDASAALYLFLGSTAVLLVGIAQIARDIRLSQMSVRYEAKRVLTLGTPDVSGAGPQGEHNRAAD